MRSTVRYVIHPLLIALGLAIAAFGVVIFIIPNSIVIGSATGLARIINQLYGIRISATVGVINIALFLFGFFALGKKFAATIAIGTFTYPIFMRIFEGMENLQHMTDDPLIAAIYGGSLVGLGIGLVIKAGASTGGTDVIAVVFQRKFGIPVGITMYLVDFLILLLQAVSAESSNEILLGIITTVLYSVIAEKVVIMGDGTIQLLIVSRKYKEIRKKLADMVIGVSVLYGESGYLSERNEMLLCVVSTRELNHVQEEILHIDPETFIIINGVKEVKGRGYTFDVGRAEQIRKKLANK